jgi:hypothetical protein
MQKHSISTTLLAFSFFTTLSLNAMAESANPENWYECPNTYYTCCECPEEYCYDRANVVTIAPEFYHLARAREGGTKQNGNLNGIRVSYDHIKRCKLYWGAQAFYGTGILDGYTGGGTRIRSRWTDEMVEGNLGYTFQTNSPAYFSFTPFGGYGYFRETNKFSSPSPFDLKFTTSFSYFSYGFLSSARVSPCLTMGLNARFRTPWEPRCKVSEDPEFEDIEQIVGERLQYRIEIPIVYKRKFLCGVLEFGLMPFYEVREYGGKENFPFDYFKTTIDIYGISLQGIFHF